MTPVGAPRSTSSRASARNRAAGRSTGAPSGSGASSSTRTKRSSMMRPALTSGIDALLERFDPHALDSIDEQLVRPRAQLDIGRRDVLDHVGDLAIGHGGTENRAELGVLAGAPADRHLVEFFAIFFDAENADVADVMMTASVDAAGNVDVQPAEAARAIEILEAARDLFGNRNRPGVGEAAI